MDGALSHLFSPCEVGTRTAPNRLVAQAMEACDAAERGAPSARTVARYARLAQGGWGTVFVEATSVTPSAVARARGLVLSTETAEAFAGLVRTFREANDASLILIQLTHSGRQTHGDVGPVTVYRDPASGARYLSADEIEVIRDQFVSAALLAEKVGFDGVDYKLCHGYLGTELLRPANTRPDRWGGSWENRARFVTSGLDGIRAQLSGSGFLLGARITFYEKLIGGVGTNGPDSASFDPTEPLDLVRLLADHGADYVNVSGGGSPPASQERILAEERRVATLFFERHTHEYVERHGLHLTVVGTGYSAFADRAAALADARIKHGHTDLAGWGRQIFADPLYPAKTLDSEPADYCVGCGGCVRLMTNHRTAGCVAHDPFYRAALRATR